MGPSLKSIAYRTIAAACIVLLLPVSFAIYTVSSVERGSHTAALALDAAGLADRLLPTYSPMRAPETGAAAARHADEIKKLDSAISALNKPSFKDAVTGADQTSAAGLASEWTRARHLLEDPSSDPASAAAALAEIEKMLLEYAEESSKRVGAASNRLSGTVFILSLIAFAAVGLMALMMTRMVIAPLDAASASLDRTAAEDPAQQLEFGSTVELARLAAAVNTAIDALREQTGNYRRSVYAAPYAVLELDEEGNIASANGEAERLAGGGIAGRPLEELVSTESAQHLRTALDTVFRGGVVRGCELRMPSQGGVTSLVELFATPVSTGGSVTGCICIIKDLDEVKKLRAELEKTRHDSAETSRRLTDTIKDLEDFALLAVRRELKMQEIREMFKKLQDDTGASRKHPPAGLSTRVHKLQGVDKDHA